MSRVEGDTAFLLNEPVNHFYQLRVQYAGGVMDLKDIKAIVDLMKKNSISEFELEKGQEFKIRLKRSSNGGSHGMEDAPAPFYLPPGTPVPTQLATAASQGSGPAS